MPNNHPSGLPNTYTRVGDHPEWVDVIFGEDKFATGADFNEMQEILRNRARRVSNTIMKDGDRIQGADIIVNAGAGTVTLTAGKVYLQGDIREVTTATLTAVPMAGDVKVGLRLSSSYVTHLDEPSLVGLMPGTEAEGEPSAARTIETVAWGWGGDGAIGDLFQVYLLKDGVALDQTPPPNLSGVNAAIALYDRGAHGHYVVSGCEVSAIGLISGAQHFSIGAGEANINGFKRTREADLRHTQIEEPDLGTVDAESRTFTVAGTQVFTPYHGPISGVLSVIVEKEITDTVTHGGVTGSSDALTHGSVTSLIEVKQGGTTYVAGTSYVLNADKVDWSPAGVEPATSSSYTVKYRYLEAVSVGTGYTFTGSNITIFNGVIGGQAIIRYTWKQPRIDLLCLNSAGEAIYVKGVSAEVNPVAPITPTQLLKLAEISNRWSSAPLVKNSEIKRLTFEELQALKNYVYDQAYLTAQQRLMRGIDEREPVSKKGTFVEAFHNDYYRDLGIAQTAAIVEGGLQLAIDPTFFRMNNTNIMLDYTETVIVNQDYVTGCVKINEYQNFTPLPASLGITPRNDYWTEYTTTWLSDATRQVMVPAGSPQSSTEAIQNVSQSSSLIPFLRQIPVAFTISGFGVGEILTTLTFDNINVKPAGIQTANALGEITGTFIIPANVVAGQKSIRAVGAGNSYAENFFVGQGKIEAKTMQKIVTVSTPASPPPAGVVWSGSSSRRADPQAQNFVLAEARHVTGINLKFCAKGSVSNACFVEIVKVRDGTPTTDVIAQKKIGMATVVLNAWTEVKFPVPVFLEADIEYAFVIKTNDGVHSVSIANIGGFDVTLQQYVGAQPYAIGERSSSSNATQWTSHPESDITFRVAAAQFTATQKIVDLGILTLVNCSDLIVKATVDLPTQDTTVYFEIERPNGQIYRLAPNQWLPLQEFLNGAVRFRAVLKGTTKVSPTLYEGVTLVAGSLRTTGTYVTRAFPMGTAIRLTEYFKAFLPSGSTVSVDIDATDNNWVNVPVTSVTALNGGWVENKHNKASFTAVQGRVRLTLAGAPAARPIINDLMALVV